MPAQWSATGRASCSATGTILLGLPRPGGWTPEVRGRYHWQWEPGLSELSGTAAAAGNGSGHRDSALLLVVVPRLRRHNSEPVRLRLSDSESRTSPSLSTPSPAASSTNATTSSTKLSLGGSTTWTHYCLAASVRPFF